MRAAESGGVEDEAAKLTKVCELWEAAVQRAEDKHGVESEKLLLPLLKAAEVIAQCMHDAMRCRARTQCMTRFAAAMHVMAAALAPHARFTIDSTTRWQYGVVQ